MQCSLWDLSYTGFAFSSFLTFTDMSEIWNLDLLPLSYCHMFSKRQREFSSCFIKLDVHSSSPTHIYLGAKFWISNVSTSLVYRPKDVMGIFMKTASISVALRVMSCCILPLMRDPYVNNPVMTASVAWRTHRLFSIYSSLTLQGRKKAHWHLLPLNILFYL